jgi:hypothetical protein
MKVDVDAQRLQKSAAEGECDDLCIFENDKIVWVKKGKGRVAGAGEKLPYGSQGGTVLTILSKADLDTKHAVIRGVITRDDARAYCEAHDGKVPTNGTHGLVRGAAPEGPCQSNSPMGPA